MDATALGLSGLCLGLAGHNPWLLIRPTCRITDRVRLTRIGPCGPACAERPNPNRFWGHRLCASLPRRDGFPIDVYPKVHLNTLNRRAMGLHHETEDAKMKAKTLSSSQCRDLVLTTLNDFSNGAFGPTAMQDLILLSTWYLSMYPTN